jgi:signal transduction histidine kinase
VVQEALTNALKYADGPARLRVTSDPGRLRISCANPVGAARANGSRLGLQGMSERVAMLGGTLTCGATPESGFVVDVDIPLAPEGLS